MALRVLSVNPGTLRDEFVCPITRELMRDPVIAADGHTYDREGIEQWLLQHQTSPKTGLQMDSKNLIPNITLRKLIRDLAEEGGAGLYIEAENASADDKGSGAAPYCNALVLERRLTLKCLGPLESSWNGRSFRVYRNGVTGGRRRPDPEKQDAKQYIPFQDPTVSRRHFHVTYDEGVRRFYIQDLGSAGGTFLRIAAGEKKPLHDGMMFMIGKHQLLVKDVRPSAGAEGDALSAKMQGLSLHSGGTRAGHFDGADSEPKGARGGPGRPAARITECVLRCYAPEGTPIQGNEYAVGLDGATLGRKQHNEIHFCQRSEDGTYLGIDSSVSGEHARIVYDEEIGGLALVDGGEQRGSTNGTWVRLSAMHEQSHLQPIPEDGEVLIGTVRFLASVDEVIVERDAKEVGPVGKRADAYPRAPSKASEDDNGAAQRRGPQRAQRRALDQEKAGDKGTATESFVKAKAGGAGEAQAPTTPPTSVDGRGAREDGNGYETDDDMPSVHGSGVQEPVDAAEDGGACKADSDQEWTHV